MSLVFILIFNPYVHNQYAPESKSMELATVRRMRATTYGNGTVTPNSLRGPPLGVTESKLNTCQRTV
jgi:hypothetical protein